MNKKSILTSIISLLSIGAFLVFIINDASILIEDNSIDFALLLTMAALLTPAILGLWKFRNRATSKLIIGGYILYGLLTIGGFANVLTADDPISAGLPMMMFVFPYAVFFSLLLLRIHISFPF